MLLSLGGHFWDVENSEALSFVKLVNNKHRSREKQNKNKNNNNNNRGARSTDDGQYWAFNCPTLPKLIPASTACMKRPGVLLLDRILVQRRLTSTSTLSGLGRSPDNETSGWREAMRESSFTWLCDVSWSEPHTKTQRNDPPTSTLTWLAGSKVHYANN